MVDEIAIVRLHSTPITVSERNQPTVSSNVSNDPPPTKMCALENLLGDTSLCLYSLRVER